MSYLTDRLEEDGVHTYPLDVPISAGNRRSIELALSAITSFTTSDWQCDRPECTEDNPLCSHQELVIAQKHLLSIIRPQHRSLNPDRLGSAGEDIFLRAWQKMNSGESYDDRLLEYLLSPSRAFRDPMSPMDQGYLPPVSQRDAEVAATVIQWLGTNCGRSFIESAQREIKEANAERREIDSNVHKNRWMKQRILPLVENVARETAMRIMRADDPKFTTLVDMIIASIQIACSSSSPDEVSLGEGI